MHLVGASVSELVHEGVLTMEFNGSADDLARICHAHPTLSEAVHDAAMAVRQARDPQGELIAGTIRRCDKSDGALRCAVLFPGAGRTP